MRKLALVLLLLVSSRAHADSFAELGGGLVAPVSDQDWTNLVEPSVKLAARFGGGGPTVEGMMSVDWTPLSADATVLTLNRFRILGHVQARNHLAKNLTLTGRLGAGVDILHESAEVTVPFVGTFKGSDTDVGIAFEAAGGVWFAVGATQLGVELALPISYHSNSGNPNNPNDPNDAKFDWTSIDIDVLFGIRFGL
jgi:hypothetical protein